MKLRFYFIFALLASILSFSTTPINAQTETPVGTIIIWPGPLSTIPDDWKLCNGEYLLASRYPELLSVVQDYWGVYQGNGATQSFKLPDLRGVFVRGVSEERIDDYADPGKDSRISTKGVSNEVGSYQQDAFQNHTHPIGSGKSDKQSNSQRERERFADFGDGAAPPHQSGGPASSARSSNETRPKNAYINYIIKVE